jgi:AbrB family looped-hinge helix DNA binding protein
MNAHSKIETGRMTSKGQVLLPKAVREAIGLHPNKPYKVTVNEHNEAVISPIGFGPEDAEIRQHLMRVGLEKLRGTSKLGMTTDEYMKLIRGDAEP